MKDEEREELEFQSWTLSRDSAASFPRWWLSVRSLGRSWDIDVRKLRKWGGFIEGRLSANNLILAVDFDADSWPELQQKLTDALNELYSDLAELFPE